MLIAVPKEITADETRVALIPYHVADLIAAGHKVNVEKNAGIAAGFTDEDYHQAGAFIYTTAKQTCQNADIILKIWAPLKEELQDLTTGQTIICNTQKISQPALFKKFADNKINLFGLDLIPRISRAQNMDILSSQDMISGYAAAVLGANYISSVMPLLMTSAGTLPPIKVLIIGLGVAGLQAAATARRLGAQVFVSDKRAETEEQTISIGAVFLKELDNTLLPSIRLIITSAQIKGKPAPKVLSEQQLSLLPAGCVIMDMAADTGGNITPQNLSQNITLVQDSHLSRNFPNSASILYSGNMINFCRFLIKDNSVKPDFTDEIIKTTSICWQGLLQHPFFMKDKK